MFMKSSVSLLLLLSATWMSQTAQLSKGEVATVHILAVDPRGEHIPNVTVETFQDTWSDRNLSKKFISGSAKGLPFGIYRARVFATGFKSAQREIFVFQNEIWNIVE